MKYEIVYSVNEDFSEAVKTMRERMALMLSRGWAPQGGIAVTTLGQLGTTTQLFSVTQAIVHGGKGLSAIGDYWAESADKLRSELVARRISPDAKDDVITANAGDWFIELDDGTQQAILKTMRAQNKS